MSQRLRRTASRFVITNCFVAFYAEPLRGLVEDWEVTGVSVRRVGCYRLDIKNAKRLRETEIHLHYDPTPSIYEPTQTIYEATPILKYQTTDH
jgi:hypothetical protein